MYEGGYNAHAKGWGERVGMLPEMVKRCEFRTVLDVGCGRGQDVAWLLAAGKDAHGVDVAPAAMAALDTKRFSARDLTDQAGWGSRRFDAVVTSDVLEHLRPEHVPGAVLRLVDEARRWLGIRTAAFETKSGERWGYSTDVIHPTRKPSEWWQARVRDAAATLGRTVEIRITGRGWFVAEFKE